jgi:hypothetical protein
MEYTTNKIHISKETLQPLSTLRVSRPKGLGGLGKLNSGESMTRIIRALGAKKKASE